MNGLSDTIIEKKAAELRQKLGLAGVFAPCMFTALEEFARKAKSFSFRPALASELGSFEAAMNDEEHTLIIRESVLEAVKAGQERARFTVAHELGHYLLGHRGTKQRSANKAIYATAKDRQEEHEADLFASYFLVPTHLATNLSSPNEIAERFQVSSQAAEIAFVRVQREKRRSTGEKRQPPDNVIDFLKKARDAGRTLKSDISEFE
jgi:hypothetical protein